MSYSLEIEGLVSHKHKLEAEIERLQELLRGVGANRYWEGRWRDEVARIERLEAERDIVLKGFEDACDAIGCPYDNEALLMAIAALRDLKTDRRTV